MKNNYLILYNPISGNRKSLVIIKKLKIEFDRLNYNYKIIKSEYSGHMIDLCATNLSYKNIIIIGGDGTFNEALNGVMINPMKEHQVLGFLPGGTGNSFLYDLEAQEYSEAIKLITRGRLKKIDILKLDFQSSVKYSLNIVGWGLVSDINIMSEKLRFLGPARYNISSLYYILNKKNRFAKINIDGNKREDEFLFILCCNTIHTGKGMKAAPYAKLDDGLLDIILVRSDIPKLSLISLLLKIFKGNHIKSKYVEYQQVKKVGLYPSKDEILNVDGENKWSTPVKISILPQKLSIYA